MATLSVKYLAGFLDADGCIAVAFKADCRKPQLSLSFSQKAEQDEVLHRIHEEFGGSMDQVTNKSGRYTRLVIGGNRRVIPLLNRVRPFLVIKRHYADVCLEMCERSIGRDEVPAAKEHLKIHRKQRSLPLPKHPTRKWLAGYIDGDGCISVKSLNKASRVANLVLHIASSDYDTEGLEIIQKQFGGRINLMRDGRVRQLAIALPPSKVEEIFSPIVSDMIVKQDQADFVLRCAAMGHFRDGERIKAALKHLKAHPHRLNEPKPNIPVLMETVRDLPKHKRVLTPEEREKLTEGRKRWLAMRQSATAT